MKATGHTQPQNIISLINSRNVKDDDLNDVIRIKDALCIENKENIVYPQNLSKKNLKKMAAHVNNTYLHYSGNCVLLSACLHYNIHHRQDILSSKNTMSPTIGFETTIVDRVIFGQGIELSHCFNSLDEVRNEISRRYDINRESSFIITATNYTIPLIGECGHDFNAVIICEEDRPYVQFIDSWKTSNTLPTFEQLNTHFPLPAQFYIRAYHENNE
ncbi:virulence protein SpvD [Serratia proteamaculans]|uniref:T3SS effector cysteine hydrolase SpvD family protein n=1 Tax=Serratia proteamaculans TaxID=28151 RepID=UPI001075D053|nr:T3SS effector cysteine hydrolase SpvD family protein [Serratia proteamaculans]TFZ48693.1 virulence protein SpvD [Serratia proteamaculans]